MNFEELYARIVDEEAAVHFLQAKGILHRERVCAMGHAMKLAGTSGGKELYATIVDEESAVRFLQAKGVLHKERVCAMGHPMKLAAGSGGKEVRWRCHHRTCRSQMSVRKGTWLEGTRQSLKKIVTLMFTWSREWSNSKFCASQLNWSDGTISKWNLWMREVTATSLIRNPIVIGGPGLTVDVDESLFSKSKNGQGRPFPLQWVFGGVCRETRKCFLVPVPDRTRATLIPLIKEFVRPGSTIVSDEWRSYRALKREDYHHLRVNHSLNFVDPSTGAHTQGVESLWSKAKRKNRARCGTHREMVESYMCEFMWRQRLKEGDDPFEKILSDIAAFWPTT